MNDMSSLQPLDEDGVRCTLKTLLDVTREMTWAGGKTIPATPVRFNLLARPQSSTCRVCGLAGHQSQSVNKAEACRVALLSLINFWEDQAQNLKPLYHSSLRFSMALANNKPIYEMRLDDTPPIAGDVEIVIVDRLTRNYLKFLNHFARIRAKAMVILSETDRYRYDYVTEVLNDLLLKGQTRE